MMGLRVPQARHMHHHMQVAVADVAKKQHHGIRPLLVNGGHHGLAGGVHDRGGQANVKADDGPQHFAVLRHAVTDGPQVLVVLLALCDHHVAQHRRFQQLAQAILQSTSMWVS